MESDTDTKKTPNHGTSRHNISVVGSAVSPKTKRRGSNSPAISKLTLRLLAINIVALAIVAGGIFYLAQFQRGLMIERLNALHAEVGAFAAALGETAVPRDPHPTTTN